MITAFKCTRADGTDFRTGQWHYNVGDTLTLDEWDPASVGPCGRGFHVSPTALKTCQFGDRSIDRGKWRWFQVEIDDANVIARDDQKIRVSKLRVVAELTKLDVFGVDLALGIDKCRAEIATWKTIPWCKPTRLITDGDLAPLLAEWHDAIAFWQKKRGDKFELPRNARRARRVVAR